MSVITVDYWRKRAFQAERDLQQADAAIRLRDEQLSRLQGEIDRLRGLASRACCGRSAATRVIEMTRDNDDPEAREHLYRKLASLILAYMEWKGLNTPFHAEDLRRFCVYIFPWLAPDSPGRTLRLMRQRGDLNYKVTDRNNSLYEFRPLDPRRNWRRGDEKSDTLEARP